MIADQEYSADQIVLYNSDKRSYTDTYQIDFSWTPVERLDIFATFRYTDSEMTIDRPDGKTARVERPLVSQYKTLLNIQYATKFRRWVFDATAQLNGPARIPTQDGDLANDSYSPRSTSMPVARTSPTTASTTRSSMRTTPIRRVSTR